MRPLPFALVAAASLGVLHCAESDVTSKENTIHLDEVWKDTAPDVVLNILLHLSPGRREETMVHLHGPDMPHSIPQAMLYGDPFIVLRALTGPEHKSHAQCIGTTLPEHTQGQLALTALMDRTPMQLLKPFIADDNPYTTCVKTISRGRMDKEELLPPFYDLASFALHIGRVGTLHRMASALSHPLKVSVLEHYVRSGNAIMIEALGIGLCCGTPPEGFFARLPALKSAAVRIAIERLSTKGSPLLHCRRALEDDRKDIAALILCSESADYAGAIHYDPHFLDETSPIVPNIDPLRLTPAQTCKHAQTLQAIGEHARAADMLTRCLNHPHGADLFTAFIAGADILGSAGFLANMNIVGIGPARAMFHALAAADTCGGATKLALKSVYNRIGTIHNVSVAQAIDAGVADNEYLLVVVVGSRYMHWTDNSIPRLAFKFTTETAVRCVHRYFTISWTNPRKQDWIMRLFGRCVALAESVTNDARDVFLAHGFPNPPLQPRSPSTQQSSHPSSI